jgi:hypothetical protein
MPVSAGRVVALMSNAKSDENERTTQHTGELKIEK